jgi:hypothetical protein
MPTGKVIEVEITGLDQLARNLAAQNELAIKDLAGAMYREAQALIAEAKVITPWKFGTLRSSGYVELPDIQGNQIIVTAGFGGAAQAYAIYVHEDPAAHHAPPTQYKFLEEPFNRRQPGLLDRITADLKARLA